MPAYVARRPSHSSDPTPETRVAVTPRKSHLRSDSDASIKTVKSPDLKLFVGNLPFSVDNVALADLFQQAGSVEEVEVIYDKASGRSRGFAFVVMLTIEEAEAAVEQFNGYEIEGRSRGFGFVTYSSPEEVTKVVESLDGVILGQHHSGSTSSLGRISLPPPPGNAHPLLDT